MTRTNVTLTLLLVCLGGCLPSQLDDTAIDEKIAAAGRLDDCLATAECADKCQGETSCLTTCRRDVNPSVLERYDAMKTCTDSCAKDLNTAGVTDCADTTSTSCLRVCRTSRCRLELITCAVIPSYGTESCISGNTCLDTCGNKPSSDGLDCAYECIRPMTDEDQRALVKLTGCVNGIDFSGVNEAQIPQRVAQTCTGELTACYAGGLSGDKECLAGLECSDSCLDRKDPNTCFEGCATKLTLNAQDDFVRLLFCLSAQPMNDWQGLAACSTSLADCAKWTPQPKGASCVKMQSSFAQCLAKTPEALLGCLGNTLAQGQPKYARPFLDLLACQSKQCAQACGDGSNNKCQICLKANCPKASKACK